MVTASRGLVEGGVEFGGDLVEVGLADAGEARAPREVLAEQSVGVLVGASLQRRAWVPEADLDAGVDGELDVFGHRVAAVPGQCPAQLLRQRLDVTGDCGHDVVGRTARQGEQHGEPALPFDQGGDLGEAGAEQHLAFPVRIKSAVTTSCGEYGLIPRGASSTGIAADSSPARTTEPSVSLEVVVNSALLRGIQMARKAHEWLVSRKQNAS